jgi:Leucine-rich repeat (LRR) protein
MSINSFFGGFTPEMKEELEKCVSLNSLVLTECQLNSLENFPDIPELVHLDLSTNLIPDKEVSKLSKFKKLEFLSLAENKITKLSTVQQLKGL